MREKVLLDLGVCSSCISPESLLISKMGGGEGTGGGLRVMFGLGFSGRRGSEDCVDFLVLLVF